MPVNELEIGKPVNRNTQAKHFVISWKINQKPIANIVNSSICHLCLLVTIFLSVTIKHCNQKLCII